MCGLIGKELKEGSANWLIACLQGMPGCLNLYEMVCSVSGDCVGWGKYQEWLKLSQGKCCLVYCELWASYLGPWSTQSLARKSSSSCQERFFWFHLMHLVCPFYLVYGERENWCDDNARGFFENYQSCCLPFFIQISWADLWWPPLCRIMKLWFLHCCCCCCYPICTKKAADS